MGNRPLGGYRGATPSTWSATSRTGEWDGAQQFKLNKEDQWPNPVPEGPYQIERSLRFNSADSAYLSRTPASEGNRKTWTWSGWVKKTAPGTVTLLFSVGLNTDGDTGRLLMGFDASDKFIVDGGAVSFRTTTAVYRDPSSWYHILVSVDTTQSTANNRVRLYINGTEVTEFAILNNPTQNADTGANRTSAHNIGRRVDPGDIYANCYLAEVYFIDGQALTPSSFTETDATTGQLIPKAYTGTFGTNGFWLKFSDNSAATATTLGKDTSGNGNNWTPNNLSVTAGAGNDSLVDTPTSYGTDAGAGGEVRGNYATLNPLSNASSCTLTNGNLDFSITATQSSTLGGIGMASGKWYWEILISTVGASIHGITKANINLNTDYTGETADSYGYFGNDGRVYNNGTGSSVYSTYTNNDVIGVAYDADNGKLYFSKNGTFINSGNPVAGTGAVATGLSGTFFPSTAGGSAGACSGSINFGQRPFVYTAPSGFKALCTQNLPTPTITNPSTVMDAKLYTGNGSTQTISGLGFSPDLVWLKARSAAYSHQLYDQIRGAGKLLNSNSTNAETTVTDNLTAFTSSGFTLGNDAGTNQSSATYVGWCWDAGSSTVTNTQGSITSQVRANASAGFSIVTYTGTGANATVGHNLGVAPSLIIIKSRSGAYNWIVYHQSEGATKYLSLNQTIASTTLSTIWNNTAPTSALFTVGSDASINGGGDTLVAYCFAPVAGYSSFGSYTGNGSTDGPFVFTGMRPRWVMSKRTDTTGNWVVKDAARDPSNVLTYGLYPDLSAAENSGTTDVDYCSNGFKLRNTGGGMNANGGTYIYAAFAESPFQYARAR